MVLAAFTVGMPLARGDTPPAAAPPHGQPVPQLHYGQPTLHPPGQLIPHPPGQPMLHPPGQLIPHPYGIYTAPAPSQAEARGPAVIPFWDPDRPPPEGYYVTSRSNGGLIGGGVAIMTSFWLASLIAGVIAAKDEEDRGIDGDGVEASDWTPLYIPIAGPFVAIHAVDASAGGAAVLMVDGVLQTLGAGMVVWGLLDRKYRAVRATAGSSGVEVLPLVGALPGVSLRGSF
ncbi:hypothetical protein WME94_18105 [Sorangium sp. So ce429]